MNDCINRWIANLSSLDDREFEELLNHAETCKFHSGILDEYEKEALPFIKLAFPGFSGKSAAAQGRASATAGTPFHNYKGTSFTSMPTRHKPKGRSIEEEIISEKYKEILKTGFTLENCQRCLEMLEKNNSIVQNSWSNTLNKARALAGLEEKKKPKKYCIMSWKNIPVRARLSGVFMKFFRGLRNSSITKDIKSTGKHLTGEWIT